MSDKDKTASTATGCLGSVVMLPSVVIWYVLFGFMLHRLDAPTWQWALYVGYLVLNFVGIAILHFAKLLSTAE